MRDSGPSVGQPSPANQETGKLQESERMVWPGRSPLTSELLAPDEELTEVLDYEDVEENDASMPDPEIAQAVAHIPQADAFADVEMQESCPPPDPQLQLGKTRCWTERPLGHLELVSQAPMRTPVVQKTIKFPGPLFPERPLSIHEN